MAKTKHRLLDTQGFQQDTVQELELMRLQYQKELK